MEDIMTLFEKIVAGDIPSKKIYEDDTVFAFLDISQATPGHTLVIPKEATESVLTASPEVVASVNKVAQQIAIKLIGTLNASGVNILTNANDVSGQTVPHYHVHVIPRYSHDELKFVTQKHDQTLDDVYAKLKDLFE